jgi:CO/xanthine dehydrogenase FAD-binding subunit
VPVSEFVVGSGRTVLEEGELLRSITLPAAALRRRSAFRQVSLHGLGRSAALLIGGRDDSGAMDLTITASTTRPHRVRFPAPPSSTAVLDAVLDAVPADGWFDDVHGDPRWRRHMTLRFAEEIRQELGS